MEKRSEFKTVPTWVVYLFFGIGVVSAGAVRAILFFQEKDPFIAKVIWYVAIIGYMIFFFYRYVISRKRKRIVKKYNLLDKLKNNQIGQEECEALTYVVSSVDKSKENLNYSIIFIFSIVAILVDLLC